MTQSPSSNLNILFPRKSTSIPRTAQPPLQNREHRRNRQYYNKVCRDQHQKCLPRYRVPVARQIVSAYIELSRNTPLIVQLFFLYFGLPKAGILLSSEACGIIGLTFLGGSYMAESFLSGLNSVGKIQNTLPSRTQARLSPRTLSPPRQWSASAAPPRRTSG